MPGVQNLVQLLENHVRSHPYQEALYHKVDGAFVPLTYQYIWDKVISLAYALDSLGVKPSDMVGLLSDNRPEWVVSDMAILSLGAVNVPLYTTLTSEEIAYILNDSGAVAIIVETQDHLKRVLEAKSDCPALKHIILMDEFEFEDDMVHLFRELVDQGLKAEDKDRARIEAAIGKVGRGDMASIVYTSGTTGNPKGVMLSHGNFLSNVEDVQKSLPITDKDSVLSFLPLCHVFERTAGYYVEIAIGVKIYYAEDITTVADNIREVKPTVLVSVPRLYEKIHAKIYDGLRGLKKPLFTWALGVGKQVCDKRRLKLPIPRGLAFQHRIADALVFKKVRAKTGGRLRFFVSGGAPLGMELGTFFEALGLLIIEGYGLTEAAPIIACNRVEAYKFGSVGKALPSVTVKLGEDGELLAKGPNIMTGYYHLPEKTKEVLSADGWLHTGDIAQIDDDGFITIVDRKKDLIVLSNGKNVAPQVLERRLTDHPLIFQVVVLGDRRNFVTALMVPNWESLMHSPDCPSIIHEDRLAACKSKQLMDFYQGIVDELLDDFAAYHRVRKFTLLPQEFSIEAGELTPSMKPKRKIIYERYASEIDQMYAE